MITESTEEETGCQENVGLNPALQYPFIFRQKSDGQKVIELSKIDRQKTYIFV